MSVRFVAGDRVYVTDPGLAQLRAIMRRVTGTEPLPNHHGTVEAVWDDGSVLIAFDEGGVEAAGNAAPYPSNEVRPLPEPTP
jgi:hypothetical protein